MKEIEDIGNPYRTAFNFRESIKWQIEAARVRAYEGGPPLLVAQLVDGFLTRMATQSAPIGEA